MTTATGNSGISVSGVVGGSYGWRSSDRNHHRRARYSSTIAAIHTGNIARVKPMKLNPVALNASRLVRFETGSSVDAELDRRTEAYACDL